MSTSLTRWVTAKPLLFNDPSTGFELAIPVGEPCVRVESVKEACDRGYINNKDEMAVWAARTNLARGYVLIWIRGKLRGVMLDDIALRLPNPSPELTDQFN